MLSFSFTSALFAKHFISLLSSILLKSSLLPEATRFLHQACKFQWAKQNPCSSLNLPSSESNLTKGSMSVSTPFHGLHPNSSALPAYSLNQHSSS